MKRITLAACLPVLIVLLCSFTSNTLVQFMTTDWKTAQNKAFEEGKLYFVDFDASYCTTCRRMDKSTYMDSYLASYVHKNVIALKVNVQSFDGITWSQQHNITSLPTMLIFNSKGELVKRMEGYKSANELIREFDIAKAQN